MEPENLTKIEKGFASLLGRLDGKLSASEREEVTEFIDAGEYGIALETLSAILVEERKRFSVSVLREMAELAGIMGIRESVLTEELERQVTSE